MTTNLQNEFGAICQTNGWRRTDQRLAVYAFMRDNRTHPSIDDVWKAVRRQLPAITRESVFRILCDFVDARVFMRLDHIPVARFDSSAKPHGHCICDVCGVVYDFDLPADQSLVSPIPGWQVTGLEMRLSGVCPSCAQKKACSKGNNKTTNQKGKTK